MVEEYKLKIIKMLKLIKWLIFGKQCLHDYRIEYHYDCGYYCKRTYVCNKCGKFKTIKY